MIGPSFSIRTLMLHSRPRAGECHEIRSTAGAPIDARGGAGFRRHARHAERSPDRRRGPRAPLGHAPSLQERPTRRACGRLTCRATSAGAASARWACASLFREMGRSPVGARVFNCDAPDQGNMDLLVARGERCAAVRAGSSRSCAGEITSGFSMTEPAPGAGADPVNLRTRARATKRSTAAGSSTVTSGTRRAAATPRSSS